MIQLQKIWQLVPPNSKLLLAVSGGMDSMVLLDIFSTSTFKLEVAHCNFQLRGKDSKDDENLVETRCAELGVQVHIKTFNLKDLFPGKGTQEAARVARYSWFEELRKERHLDFIFTAHHEMDQTETMIFNFIRGSGIRGLRGMKMRDGNLLRPLLNESKSDIQAYQKSENVVYREDQSNASMAYSRNKIRNSLLPQMKEFNPGIVETLSRQSPLFEEAEVFIDKYLSEIKTACVEQQGDETRINITKLQTSGLPFHSLHYILTPFRFSPSQIRACVELMKKQSGKIVRNHTWEVVKDHHHLVVHQYIKQKSVSLIIKGFEDFQKSPIVAQIVEASKVQFEGDKEAWLDFEKIKFPLVIRPWKAGDYFQPLGMKGRQKISDFLTHQGVGSSCKKDQQVLCMGNQIIWVIGKRIHEKFKIEQSTHHILHLKAR